MGTWNRWYHRISPRQRLVGQILIFAVVLDLLIATLRTQQFYDHMVSPSLRVRVNGQLVSVNELAHRYQPVVGYRNSLEFPPIAILYFATLRKERLLLAYRVVREDERHPHSLVDSLYRIVRLLYFGSIRDLEYIEYTILLSSGLVEAIRFEEGKPGKLQVEHLPVQLSRTDDGLFRKTYPSHQFLPMTIATGRDATFLVFTMATWNGLFELQAAPAEDSTVIIPSLPLQSLTWRNVFHYRLWRRSGGWLLSAL